MRVMEAGHSTSPGSSHHEDLWTCHRCGWTYPNAHPSAKHRRNHKKHCGKIKGFELGSEIHKGGSSDEASSDEEGHANGGHLSHQSPQVYESAIPAGAGNLFPAAEAASTLSHPALGAESQICMGSLGSNLSREFSSSKENMSDGVQGEAPLFKDMSTSPDIKGEGSVQSAAPRMDTFDDRPKDSPKEEKPCDPVSVEVAALSELLQHDTGHKKDSQVDELQESSCSKRGTSTAQGPSHHEDLWSCHRCGWTYPNPHPSAKHRRNHKKHCGKIKGFELRSEIHDGGSSDEASSDEEHHVDKGYLLNQSPQLLHEQYEAVSPAVPENVFSATEAAGTVSHPPVCGERQILASTLANDETRETSSSKENMSDGVNAEVSLSKPVSPSSFLKGEDSVIEPSSKTDTSNEWLDNSVAGEEKVHNTMTVGSLPDLLQEDTGQKKDLQTAKLEESFSNKETSTAQEEGMYVSLLQGTDGDGVQMSEKHTGAVTCSTLLEEDVSALNCAAHDSSKIDNPILLPMEASPSLSVEEKDASAKHSAEKDITKHALDSEEMITGNTDTIVATGEGCEGMIDTLDLSGKETDKTAGAFEPGTSELELLKGGELPVKEDICPLIGNRVGDSDTAAHELERVERNLSTLPVGGQNRECDETGHNNLLPHMPVSESVDAEKGIVKEEVLLDAVSSDSDSFGGKKDAEVEAGSISTQDTENQTGHSSEQAFCLGETMAIGLKNPPDEETGDILNNADSNAEAQGQPDNVSSSTDCKALSEEMSVHKAFPIAVEGKAHSCESAQIDDMNKSKEVSVASGLHAEIKEQISENPRDEAKVMLHEGVESTPDMTNKERSFIEDIQQDNTAIISSLHDNEKLVKEPESGEQIEVHEVTKEVLPALMSNARGPEMHPETSFGSGMRAAAPGRSDSLETEMYEDAPETFETCSVGGSIDENEILDDSQQVADKELEEQSRTFLGAGPQGNELSGKSTALKGQSNGLDHFGASDVDPEDKVTQPSKLNFSGTSTTQDLKAPSPEAWQEVGTSEVGSGNNETQTEELVQAAAPKSGNMEVKNHQITDKTHTPLRSLLAKEVAGKTDQKCKSTEDRAKAGEAWGSHNVSKPKTRSIWSHCICCPAVH